MWGWVDMLPRYLLVVRRNGFIDTQGNWKEEIMIPRKEAGKKKGRRRLDIRPNLVRLNSPDSLESSCWPNI